MSSGNSNEIEKSGFAARFVEACGTSEPARIQRLLNISYQAAKNYLSGRLPDTKVLLLIAERTPYSLHWLLTGDGPKMASAASPADTALSVRQIKELIRAECVEAVNDILDHRGGESRVVVLEPEKIRSEKVSKPEPVSGAKDRTPRP